MQLLMVKCCLQPLEIEGAFFFAVVISVNITGVWYYVGSKASPTRAIY